MNQMGTLDSPARSTPTLGASVVLLLMLLSADLVLIGLHVGHLISPDSVPSRYRIDWDGSFPEILQYLKWAWLCGLIALLMLVRRTIRLAGWLLLFGFLLLTDALQIHETMGAFVAERLGLQPRWGMRARDFGEIVFAGAVGAAIVAVIVVGLVRSAPWLRRFTVQMAVLLAVLIAFGVVLDPLSGVATSASVGQAIQVVEDGGEMLAATGLVLVAHAWLTRGSVGRPDQRRAKRHITADEAPLATAVG